MDKDFVWVAGNAFSEMRLMVEGAIVLYEGDAVPLYNLAAEQPEAQGAFSTIGRALYDLRQYVLDLEEAYREENQRQNGSRV